MRNLNREGNDKSGTRIGLTLHLNSAPGILDKALANVKAHARAFDMGVQRLKQAKQLPVLRLAHSQPILNRERYGLRRLLGAHLHLRRAV
jgi:hypothetical protein